jgi:putative SOS response-associated peptidase YedK
MCGRAYETYTEKELNARYIRGSPSAEEIEQLSLIPEPVYNLCPTMNSPVLRIVNGSRCFCLMHWQLIPQYEPAFKTKLSTINARSETVFKSELFREVVERQRCIVPISGFYEWKRDGKTKRPFEVHLADEEIMSLAGIWDTWRKGTKHERSSFSILTTSANQFMKEIHGRMPVILSREDEDEWLDPEVHEQSKLEKLLKPCPSEWLFGVEVSRLVNSSKNNSPELLRPAEKSTDQGALQFAPASPRLTQTQE